MSIKAIVMAAGYGTRLRPLTDKVPKCLIEVQGKPILHRWLDKLVEIGCEETMVNTHYLAEQVRTSLETRDQTEMRILEAYEKELLGTAKTLIRNRDFFDENTEFCMLIHADNATNISLQGILDAHKCRPDGCVLTMLTFRTDKPESCGIVITDSKGVVKEYYEKERKNHGNIANGAVFIFERELIETIENWGAEDFCRDVIGKLTGKIYTWHTEDIFIDIGSPEMLERARIHLEAESN